MQFEDLKFMSIGGNCACIGFLGPNRLRGPVDNVILGNPECIDLLINGQYVDFICNASFKKEKRRKGWPTDYGYFSKYENDIVWIAHHDPTTLKYKNELEKRCETFKNFYKKVLTDINYYFTFNINEFMYNKKEHKLNHAFTEKLIETLTKYNILHKTIFVGTKTIFNNNKTWDYNSKEFNKYIEEYNLKYVEIIDNNIWDTKPSCAQFYNKVWRLLNNNKSSKWGNVLVAIAKNEELYLNNWVKYHLGIGFDKIFIYDNNDAEKNKIINCIDKSLRSFVTVIDVKNKHKQALQQECYNNFIQSYCKLFDWCAFLDVDEFITGIENINSLLSKDYLNSFSQIRIKWHLFGDDGIITRDLNTPVNEFFKTIITDKGKFSDAGKCIIRGHIKELKMNSVHFASTDDTMNPAIECYPSGKSTNDGIVINNETYLDEAIFINHYMTKTLNEFVDQKLNRLDAVKKKRVIDLSYFFDINEFTEEKEKWLESRGLKYERTI